MSTFDSIKKGLLEAIDHAEGKPTTVNIHQFDDIDVKKIRETLHMSQSMFANTFGLNLNSIQNWEQKRKQPSGASLVLLKVIEKNPNAVIHALQP